MLITDLAAWPGLQIVARHFVGEIIREQWLQLRGTSEKTAATKIGQLVGARYLLSGAMTLLQNHLALDAHLLDVEHGTVVRTARVSGNLDSIPALERALSQQVGEWFVQKELVRSGSRAVLGSPLGTLGYSQKSGRLPPRESKTFFKNALPNGKKTVHDPPSTLVLSLGMAGNSKDGVSFPSGEGLFKFDPLLRLDRAQQVRDAAIHLADQIWQRAIQVDLGTIHYREVSEGSANDPSHSLVRLPIVVTFKGDRLDSLSPRLNVRHQPDDSRNAWTTVSWTGEDAGAQALFLHHIMTHRRLFIRARNSGGNVVAVFSRWPWNMDRVATVQGNDRILFQPDSNPLLTGVTEISVRLLSHFHSDLSFDAVLVPVPKEKRVVTLELIESPETKVEQQGGTASSSTRTVQALKEDSQSMKRVRAWLLEHWAPPLMESIPVEGYLPGSHRSGTMLVTINEGFIEDVRVVQLPPEYGVARSLQTLASQLRERCFGICPDRRSHPSRTLRAQFDLHKDIHQAGLGE